MRHELAQFVQTQLPHHVLNDYPKFVAMLNKYYEWMYRKEGMSKEEIQDFRNDETKWLSRNVDKFIRTGSERFISVEGAKVAAETEISKYRAPGALSDRFHAQYLLEREFDGFVTADGDFFFDQNETEFQSPYVLDDSIYSWAYKFNHRVVKDVDTLDTHDEILLLRIMKHLYATKGTKKCIELFFKIYFDEDITIYYPKFDICVIDDNFVLDHLKYIRDDSVYQEYSYVIYVKNDPSYYDRVMTDIYLKNFHPSGFKVTLIKNVT